jgi:hypothetical protein
MWEKRLDLYKIGRCKIGRKYDASEARNSKFHRAGVELKFPVYLDREVQDYLTRRAAQRGVKLSDLVNDLLRKDIDLIEAGK